MTRGRLWLALGGAVVVLAVGGVLIFRARPAARLGPSSTEPEQVPLAVTRAATAPNVRPRNPMELQQLSQAVKAAMNAPAGAPPSADQAGADAGDDAPPDEPALMTTLHALGETNPALTIRLAREGNQRHADSPDAPERAWMLIKAMVNLNRFDDARAEATVMVEKYRGTSWARDIERHLQVHPRSVEGVRAP